MHQPKDPLNTHIPKPPTGGSNIPRPGEEHKGTGMLDKAEQTLFQLLGYIQEQISNGEVDASLVDAVTKMYVTVYRR